MDRSKTALRLVSSVCLLALAACSSGGGGGGANTTLNSTPTSGNTSGNNSSGSNSSGSTSSGNNNASTPTPTPTVSIGPPDNANVTIQAGAAFDFKTNFPAVGTVFGVRGPAVKLTSPTVVEAANKGTTGTITYRGLTTSGGSSKLTFDVSIPDIGLNATNVIADGKLMTLPDGGNIAISVGSLNYTAAATWAFKPAGSTAAYEGMSVTGWGTPIANVPTTGSATYVGNGATGGTVGFYYVPDGKGGISSGAIVGDVSPIVANFTTGGVTGTLRNMTAHPDDGSAATPWNDVTLTASINRLTNNVSFVGTTSTSGAPAGAGVAGFSSAATGGLGGAFFGPNAEEVGGTWTLIDPNATGGGKTAFGNFVATCTTTCGTGGSSTPPPTTGVSITAPGLGVASFGGTGVGTNFTTNLPPVGTSLIVAGGTVAITPTSVADFSTGQVTAVFRGTVTSGGLTWPVFDLNVPSLSLTAANVRGDGTVVTLADGGKVNAKFSGMTYTLLGGWSYTPASGSTSYLGHVVTGYGTAPASVPTSGSANYTGAGGVIGAYAIPSGSNAIQFGTLVGDANLNVNFATNTTSGSFTNMQATATGSNTATPWNDLALNGTLTRGPNNVTMNGQIVTGTNSGPAGFSAAAHGNFSGALYGPTAQEVGGTWSLSELGGGGKAAFGTFGAK